MTRTDIIQMHIKRVLSWDREDICELANLLYDLDYCIRYDWDAGMDCWRMTGEVLKDHFDPDVLPTSGIPVGFENDQQIFATDNKGNCLISLDFDDTNLGHNFEILIKRYT